MQPQLVLAKFIIGKLSGWLQPNLPCSCIVPFHKELSSRSIGQYAKMQGVLSLVHYYLSDQKVALG
jgi:hypothetical protein